MLTIFTSCCAPCDRPASVVVGLTYPGELQISRTAPTSTAGLVVPHQPRCRLRALFFVCSFVASLTSMSSASPCLIFGSGIGSLWVDFSSDSCMGTSTSRHNRVIREGCMRALVYRQSTLIHLPQTYTIEPTRNRKLE